MHTKYETYFIKHICGQVLEGITTFHTITETVGVFLSIDLINITVLQWTLKSTRTVKSRIVSIIMLHSCQTHFGHFALLFSLAFY